MWNFVGKPATWSRAVYTMCKKHLIWWRSFWCECFDFLKYKSSKIIKCERLISNFSEGFRLVSDKPIKIQPFPCMHTTPKNIARVRNSPDVALLNSLCGLRLLSFCLFVSIKCLKGLKSQKSFFESKFKSAGQPLTKVRYRAARAARTRLAKAGKYKTPMI